MISFLIKRSFWSFWENMLSMVLINLFFIIHVALVAVALNFLMSNLIVMIVIIAIVSISALFYLITVSKLVFELLKNQERITIRKFFQNYKSSVVQSIPMLIFCLIYFSLLLFTMRNYTKLEGTMVTTVIFFLLAWIILFSLIAFGYFLSLQHHMNDKLFVTIKKCLILFFAHPLLSIVLAFFTIFQLSISVVLLFFLPGISSVIVLWEEATRILMLKYDYIEKNPDIDIRKFPWDVVLADEKERLGHKSVRDLLNI